MTHTEINIINEKIVTDYLNNRDTLPSHYSTAQVYEFKLFCIRHDIRFNNMVEYSSALSQYYTGE
jgi:hypothetical protein